MIAKLLTMPTDKLEEMKQKSLTNEKTLTNDDINNISNNLKYYLSNIMVREIWIGNLPSEITEKKLNANLGVFGKVENIELFLKSPQNFAFIRYRCVAEATKAYDAQQNLILLLECQNLKISFSDHLRRMGIVGDSYPFVQENDLSNVLYIGYGSNTTVPPEKHIKSQIERYADVKSIVSKRAPFNTGCRSFVLVEVSNSEQAKKVYKKFMRDSTNERRLRLGDKRCEVAVLVKPTKNIQQVQVPKTFPMNYNQPTHHNKTPVNISNIAFPNLQNLNVPQNRNIPIAPPNILNKFGTNFPQNFQNTTQNNNNYVFKNLPNYEKPEINNFRFNMQNSYIPEIDKNHKTNPLENQPIKKTNQNDLLDLLTNLLKQEKDNSEIKIVDDNTISNEDYEQFWSGFITRSKQHRVGVDARLIYGEELSIPEYNLNISLRTTYQESVKKIPKAIVIFTPSDQTQINIFKDYIKYFSDKKRSGVVTIRNLILYIMPKCEETDQIIILNENEILGYFTENNSPIRDQNFKIVINDDKFKKKNDNPNKNIIENNISSSNNNLDKNLLKGI